MGHKGHYGEYTGNARHSRGHHHMVNSWEEEDVKRGRKLETEGHKGHAEALFDDAHDSYYWHEGMDTHAEHNRGASRKSSPMNKDNWIQEATADIKKRGTEGVCTGYKFGGPTCPPGSKRYNLAKTFKKMAKK